MAAALVATAALASLAGARSSTGGPIHLPASLGDGTGGDRSETLDDGFQSGGRAPLAFI